MHEENYMTPAWLPAVIAVFGVTATFCFFLVGQVILKAYDNAREHREAIVRLERLLNEQLDTLDVHVRQIQTLRGTVSAGQLLLDMPRSLPVDDAVALRILDIDIINRVLGLWMSARRINIDVDNLRAAYGQLSGVFLGGKIERNGYIANASFVVSGFEAVAEALGNYKTEAEQLLARVRIHARRKQKWPMAFVQFLTRNMWTSFDSAKDDAVRRELAEMAEEVLQTRARGSIRNRA